MQKNYDCLVLGAGIVGLATALKIQELGRSVLLVDKGEAGAATSYGNAGIIERSSIFPHAFPQQLGEILSVIGNKRLDVRFHWNALMSAAPFLYRYWRASSPERHLETAKAALPLIENCMAEHMLLVEAAGAQHLIRQTGWLKFTRNPEKMEKYLKDLETVKPYGVKAEVVDAKGFALKEPHITAPVVGAVHYTDPANVTDPQELSRAYLRLFEQRGGVFVKGDARSMDPSGDGWRVDTVQGAVTGREIVLALGPWSAEIAGTLGYHVPLGIKRGYHRHYRPVGNAVLNHTLYDADYSYCAAPMLKGVRITTGAEFAFRDGPPTPDQMNEIEPLARSTFPLGEAVEADPWMGSRPCTPDMLPVIGRGSKHKGLWFAFGHSHHGLTHAAVTGRLVAEMMSGEKTFCDPTPYRIERF